MSSVELLRVDFRVVALERDDEGVPTGERVLADGQAFAGGLDDLPAAVRKVLVEYADTKTA